MRALVVGNGVMGRNHVRVLKALGHQVETLDPRVGAGATHTSLTEAIVDWTDTACIATPIDELAQIASLWMKRGKDVLVEKPGACTLIELLGLEQDAEDHGVRMAVGFTERFNPAVQSLSDHLHRVGHVHHIHIRRLGYAADRGGDPALDLATHDLDVLDALGFDLSLEQVVRSDHHLAALLVANHVSPLVIPGTASVSLEASHLHPSKVRELEVVGDKGVLQLDYQAQTLGFLTADRLRTALPVSHFEPLEREWTAFLNGDGSAGTTALRIAEQIAEDAMPLAPCAHP
jgi:predicted dehydrogenase